MHLGESALRLALRFALRFVPRFALRFAPRLALRFYKLKTKNTVFKTKN